MLRVTPRRDARSNAATSRPTTATAAARPSTPSCATPSSFGTDLAPNEIRGTSPDGQLWGLAFADHIPPKVGDQVKIVWRMTGSGPLRVTLTSPRGTHPPLTFGPEAHTGASTYDRPGDEWGTGIALTLPGCWQIHLARDDTQGDVRLVVAT